MKIAPLTLSDIAPWSALLAIAFKRPTEQMAQLLHFMQPDTKLVAWGAWDGPTFQPQSILPYS